MGQNNSSRATIKTEIKKEISTSIKNTTENITKIVNEATNNISTSMAKSAAAKIQINTAASNELTVGDIVAIDSDVDIEQTAEVKSENIAIINIVQSTEAMMEMADKISAAVNHSVKNDSVASESMKQAAALEQATKNAGGPEAFVDKIADTVKEMIDKLNVGGSTSNNYNNETIIRQKIKFDISNTTINETNITNKVTTNIKTAMSMAAEAKCEMSTTAGNIMDIGGIVAVKQDGERSIAELKQKISLKAFNKCFIDLNMGSKIVNAIAGDISNFVTSETENNNKVSAETEQEASIKETTEKNSGINEMGKKLIDTGESIGKNLIKTAGEVVNTVKGGSDNNTKGGTENSTSGVKNNTTLPVANDSTILIMIIIGGGIIIAIALIIYFNSQRGNYQDDIEPRSNNFATRSDNLGTRSDNLGTRSDNLGSPSDNLNSFSDDLGPDGLPIRGTQVGGLFSLEESEIYGMTEAFMGGGKDPYGNVYLWATIAVLVYYVYGKSLRLASITIIVIIAYIVYLGKEQTKNF
jgi:hypothetical protein